MSNTVGTFNPQNIKGMLSCMEYFIYFNIFAHHSTVSMTVISSQFRVLHVHFKDTALLLALTAETYILIFMVFSATGQCSSL